MHPQTKKFFEEHPEEHYWYYSTGIRVANPALRRTPGYRPEPWPDTHPVHWVNP